MYHCKKVAVLLVFLFFNVLLFAQGIKKGITTSQTKLVLGEPSYVDVTLDSSMSAKTVFIYSEELNYYYLAFYNDTLVEINPHPSYNYYKSKNRLPNNYYRLASYSNIDTSLSLNYGNMANTKSFGQKCLPFKPRETQILLKWFFR